MDAHPHLAALCARARVAADGLALGIVHPCDASALQACTAISGGNLARPVLIGPRDRILRAAHDAAIGVHDYEIVDAGPGPADSSRRAVELARDGALGALMKGALHTDEFLSGVIQRSTGLLTRRRISHAFVFDLPRYRKPLALADCVVNVAPRLRVKRDIVGNAIDLLRVIGVEAPKVAIVTPIEVVSADIPSTLDAAELAKAGAAGAWPGAIVEGPLAFDNAISAEAARIKGIASRVAGDVDLMLVPDLDAGNMLYKSFIYVGGGECAGLVLGCRVPIVLTSRADSMGSRVASVALAVLAARGGMNFDTMH